MKQSVYKGQDEAFVKIKTMSWALHNVYKKGDELTMLLGAQNVNEEAVKTIQRTPGVDSVKEISYNYLVLKLAQMHSTCYKEGTWKDLEWKWASNAQVIIEGFLNLLCRGWIYWLPDHWNNWIDADVWKEENKKKNQAFKKIDEDTIIKTLAAQNIDYKDAAKKENLGYCFDVA